VYVSVPSIKEFVDVAFLNKLATGSGVERLLTVQYAWGYFLEYPILGIGWGSATSNDLIVLLLSNCGILGFLAFAVLVGHVIARLVAMFRNSRRRHPAARITVDEIRAVMLLVSFLLLIALSVVGGFQYGFPYFWVILGLCVACTASLRGSLSSYRQRNTSRLLA
jgi:O-antigen ligase